MTLICLLILYHNVVPKPYSDFFSRFFFLVILFLFDVLSSPCSSLLTSLEQSVGIRSFLFIEIDNLPGLIVPQCHYHLNESEIIVSNPL